MRTMNATLTGWERDAQADTETLEQLLVDEPVGEPEVSLEFCLSGCMEPWGDDRTMRAYIRAGWMHKAAEVARRRAAAAFALVPGLRG